jgi:uncharacterized membrane protein
MEVNPEACRHSTALQAGLGLGILHQSSFQSNLGHNRDIFVRLITAAQTVLLDSNTVSTADDLQQYQHGLETGHRIRVLMMCTVSARKTVRVCPYLDINQQGIVPVLLLLLLPPMSCCGPAVPQRASAAAHSRFAKGCYPFKRSFPGTCWSWSADSQGNWQEKLHS